MTPVTATTALNVTFVSYGAESSNDSPNPSIFESTLQPYSSESRGIGHYSLKVIHSLDRK
jgi:hypothetical protein